MSPVVALVTSSTTPFERVVAVAEAASRALGPGLLVQLRDKTAEPEALLASARALRVVTSGSCFVVNGRDLATSLEVARAAEADGVHVTGAALAAGAVATARRGASFVSAATHDDADVERAAGEGASLVFVSPIFATPGKGPPRGLAALASARRVVDAMHDARPLVFALGGIDPANAAACAASGADGAAVIRAAFEAEAEALPRVLRTLAAPFVR